MTLPNPPRAGRRAPAPRRRPRRAVAGFTLLEAIIALSLFAIAGMAMYSLYNTNLISLMRVQDVARQTPIARYALERLATVDPWREPSGAFTVDGHDVTWRATLVEAPRHGQNSTGIKNGFDFGLYAVEFDVSHQGRRIGVWHTRLVGFERVRGRRPAVPVEALL